MKRAYFMTVIDGVFCMRRAFDQQAFQSSRLTGSTLWSVITTPLW